jgi:hypothetical protein
MSSHHRVRAGLAAFGALLLLGACTGSRTPTGYGDTTRTNFMKGCLEAAKKQDNVSDPDDYCTCSYRAIVKQIPFERFKKINSDLSDDPGPLPKEMLQIRDDCLKTGTG